MKTIEKNIIRVMDIPFCGDFVLLNTDDNNRIIYDSEIDGYDLSPSLSIAPVLSIEIKKNKFMITTSENLALNG